jgi:hypothetical protein
VCSPARSVAADEPTTRIRRPLTALQSHDPGPDFAHDRRIGQVGESATSPDRTRAFPSDDLLDKTPERKA